MFLIIDYLVIINGIQILDILVFCLILLLLHGWNMINLICKSMCYHFLVIFCLIILKPWFFIWLFHIKLPLISVNVFNIDVTCLIILLYCELNGFEIQSVFLNQFLNLLFVYLVIIYDTYNCIIMFLYGVPYISSSPLS